MQNNKHYYGIRFCEPSSNYLMHYGRKNMRWGEHIFGEEKKPSIPNKTYGVSSQAFLSAASKLREKQKAASHENAKVSYKNALNKPSLKSLSNYNDSAHQQATDAYKKALARQEAYAIRRAANSDIDDEEDDEDDRINSIRKSKTKFSKAAKRLNMRNRQSSNE